MPQALKYEAYHDTALSRFLLLRSLSNQVYSYSANESLEKKNMFYCPCWW